MCICIRDLCVLCIYVDICMHMYTSSYMHTDGYLNISEYVCVCVYMYPNLVIWPKTEWIVNSPCWQISIPKMPVLWWKIQRITAQSVSLLQSEKLFIFKSTSLESTFDGKLGYWKCHIITHSMLSSFIHMPILIQINFNMNKVQQEIGTKESGIIKGQHDIWGRSWLRLWISPFVPRIYVCLFISSLKVVTWLLILIFLMVETTNRIVTVQKNARRLQIPS